MRTINTVTLLVHDYDEAIAFYTENLGFQLVEDTAIANSDKRWVIISPGGVTNDGQSADRPVANLLLARASGEQQSVMVGNQAGGRVFLFLNTDDFWRDHTSMINAGVIFKEIPREEAYGIVAVFQDLYGNLWDLIQHH